MRSAAPAVPSGSDAKRFCLNCLLPVKYSLEGFWYHEMTGLSPCFPLTSGPFGLKATPGIRKEQCG